MIKILLTTLLLLSISVSSYSQVKIGIALPLMKNSDNAEDKKLGVQMLKGINDALEEYNKSSPGNNVTLVIEDTKRDQAAALQIINKFGSDSSVIAIFGPVFSSEIINNAGAPAFHKIPLITPTATQSFLAEKNEYLFQFNPTYDIRGRLMAKYSMESGLKNFAILSEDTYGKNFAESFTDEVTKNGGNIVYTGYYSKDKADLTEEMDELKNKLSEKEKFIDFGSLDKTQTEKLKKVKLKFSYLDSLVNERLVVSIYKLFGANADRVTDSAGISTVTGSDKKGTYIFGRTDAVYIPVSGANEISKIASQYFSGNINLPLIGTSDWNNEKILNENKMYIKELIFDSDFYLKDKSGNDLINLSEADIKNYYFGYDGMKLILSKISEGNRSREGLNDALENVKNFSGEHNNVSISERTNHEMSVMSYKKGKMEKLKNFVY